MKLKLIGRLPPCENLCSSQDQTKKYTKEENEETTNQNSLQGIHRHMLFQTGQQRRNQQLADCG